MNQVELLQGEMVTLSRRIKRLEIIFERRGLITEDIQEAERTAEALGFSVEIVHLPPQRGSRDSMLARKRIAERLAKRKWTPARIARAFGCSDRTARALVNDSAT